jgi:hypothetical protein
LRIADFGLRIGRESAVALKGNEVNTALKISDFGFRNSDCGMRIGEIANLLLRCQHIVLKKSEIQNPKSEISLDFGLPVLSFEC